MTPEQARVEALHLKGLLPNTNDHQLGRLTTKFLARDVQTVREAIDEYADGHSAVDIHELIESIKARKAVAANPAAILERKANQAIARDHKELDERFAREMQNLTTSQIKAIKNRALDMEPEPGVRELYRRSKVIPREVKRTMLKLLAGE